MKIKTMKQNCNNCKYFVTYEDDLLLNDLGDCLRYPKDERKFNTDWCGEWKKRK